MKRYKYEFSPNAKVKITKNKIRFLVVMSIKASAAPTKIEAAFMCYSLIMPKKALQSCFSSVHYLPENDFLGSCLAVVHLLRPQKVVCCLELLGYAFCFGEGFCQLADTL